MSNDHDGVTAEEQRVIPKIRRLKVKDLNRIADFLEKSTSELGEQCLNGVISSKKTEVTTDTSTVEVSTSERSDEEAIGEMAITIATGVLTKLVDYFNKDVALFFADLLEVSLDEYLEMDIDTPYQIIIQIKEAPEAGFFFTMHYLRSKLTKWFEKPLKVISARFDSIFAEAKEDS